MAKKNDERPNLKNLLKKWQPRLRLMDWKIDIKYARERELPRECQAHCYMIGPTRSAWIRIMEPKDYKSDRRIPQDIEDSVVHELLHISATAFDPGPDERASWLACEQHIETVARALVALDRGLKTWNVYCDTWG